MLCKLSIFRLVPDIVKVHRVLSKLFQYTTVCPICKSWHFKHCTAFKWQQLDSNPQLLSSQMNTQLFTKLVYSPIIPRVFVYELSGSGFESSCCHLNFRYGVCFERGVPWHSSKYRVWIHSETSTWHSKNIQSLYRVNNFSFITVPSTVYFFHDVYLVVSGDFCCIYLKASLLISVKKYTISTTKSVTSFTISFNIMFTWQWITWQISGWISGTCMISQIYLFIFFILYRFISWK